MTVGGTRSALVSRLLFGAACVLIGWSLLAWWGAAVSPGERFKFGAVGAARIADFETDHPTQERCSWYTSGRFEQHCRPADGGEARLAALRLGAPVLLLALLSALGGTLKPRRGLACAALAATAVAVLDIVGNAGAALAFAEGREVSVTGSGATAAVLAALFAAAAVAFASPGRTAGGRRHSASV
jgi:hypothetical protein